MAGARLKILPARLDHHPLAYIDWHPLDVEEICPLSVTCNIHVDQENIDKSVKC